ncbi:hypothetical protein [Streptomyces mirabilis]|uniref:hypothetical protein n=1 Tax=Streptomyces mirabilis TaxID=68239 RepID=UPI00331AC63E
MRRFILPVSAVLLTAACSSATPRPTLTAHDLGGPATPSHSAAAKPKPSASAKNCPQADDILVWTKVPDVPAMAQSLGAYDAATCEPTMEWLKHASPTQDGDCTEAALSKDNPGYNADAEPAARLEKVQVAIGPSC